MQQSAERRARLLVLFWGALLLWGSATAAPQQFNMYDTDLEEVVPGAAFTKRVVGQDLGAELFYMKAGTRPYSKGNSHNHPEEYMVVKFAGESKFTVQGGAHREYRIVPGGMMLIPPGLQHRGGHEVGDTIMLGIFSPPRNSNFNWTPPPATDASEELREAIHANIDTAERSEVLRNQIYTSDFTGTRIGVQFLRINGVGGRADTVLSGREAASEEVAVIYRGQVKVTSGTDVRILKAGDVYHSDRPIFYQRIGDQNTDIVRVFSPGSAGGFDLR
ncbi:MAG: hypothetical protein J4A00_04960 [Gammaproteobacteria bacterium]|nr:hypothetical protein [Gammaproteobacteria bacterium]